MQDPVDADTAAAYGATQPDYGGQYFDGDELIVLFVENLDHHRDALTARVNRPDHMSVRPTARTWADVRETNRRLQHRLLTGPTPVPAVHGVGLSVVNGEHVIEVWVDPASDDVTAAIRAAALPDAVVIKHKPRAHHLPHQNR